MHRERVNQPNPDEIDEAEFDVLRVRITDDEDIRGLQVAVRKGTIVQRSQQTRPAPG